MVRTKQANPDGGEQAPRKRTTGGVVKPYRYRPGESSHY